MAWKIFMSHSKKDVALRETIRRNLELVDIEPVFAEDFPDERPPNPKIERLIDQSIAMFVWLTPYIAENPHTRNWVMYEIGHAKSKQKDTYVFEEWDNWVMGFPIPSVTEYVVYNPSQKEHWLAIQDLAVDTIRKHIEKRTIKIHPAAVAGGVVGGLLGLRRGPLAALFAAGLGAVVGQAIGELLKAPTKFKNFPYRIICPYPTCGASFNLYSEAHRFPCPACRQIIVW